MFTTRQAQKESRRGSGPRKKRPPFNLTCANCRRRKMRCDSGQPSCMICIAYGDACQYDKPPPVSQIVKMANRLQELENTMARLRASDNDEVLRILEAVGTSEAWTGRTSPLASSEPDIKPDGSLSTRSPSVASRSEKSFRDGAVPSLSSDVSMSADGQLRYYGSTSAVHQPIVIPETPVQPVTMGTNHGDRSLLVSNASQSRSWEDFALGNAALQLDIPRETITKLLNTHWTWIHPTFMFVYRPAFMSDMSTGGPYFSPLLLSVMCSHSTRFVEKQLSKVLAPKARSLLCSEIQRDSSIPTIQALLQISAREIGQGQISQAWLYSGMAFRMSTDLGLHLDTERISSLGCLSAQDREIRTRLSWSCFLWDKAMSLYLGRTPTIQEAPSDEPTLLDNSAETEPWAPYFASDVQPVDIPVYPLTQSHAISCFTAFCRLAVIINDIITNLYSRKKPASITSLVQKQRDRLDGWYRGLDQHLKVSMHTLPTFCPPPHILTLNLLYYTTIILLHRPLHSVFFCKAASREASKCIQSLLLLLERSFGFTRITYLMAYCTYTAATIAVEDMNAGAAGASEGVKTFIRALEGAQQTCPVVRRSLDIINASIARTVPEQRSPFDHPNNNTSHEEVSRNTMPAFPYQHMPFPEFKPYRQPGDFGMDQTMPGTVLNSYPQHYLDLREEIWLAQT